MNNRFDLLVFEDAQAQKDRREKEAEHRRNKLLEIEKNGVCEGMEGPCVCKKNVTWVTAKTRYPWDIDKNPEEDPNRDIFLCENCEKYYNEYWNDMWSEYYAGLL